MLGFCKILRLDNSRARMERGAKAGLPHLAQLDLNGGGLLFEFDAGHLVPFCCLSQTLQLSNGIVDLRLIENATDKVKWTFFHSQHLLLIMHVPCACLCVSASASQRHTLHIQHGMHHSRNAALSCMPMSRMQSQTEKQGAQQIEDQ